MLNLNWLDSDGDDAVSKEGNGEGCTICTYVLVPSWATRQVDG
jgi:hypothetical protein